MNHSEVKNTEALRPTIITIRFMRKDRLFYIFMIRALYHIIFIPYLTIEKPKYNVHCQYRFIFNRLQKIK